MASEFNEFPANSHKIREERVVEAKPKKEKLEKVIDGNITQRKKPLTKRVAETFSGDDAQTVGNYILFDVIIPASKSMISDAVSQGIERMLFGDVRRRTNGGPRASSGTYISYNNQSNRNYTPNRAAQPEPRREMSRSARATHNFDEIIFETRGQAEIVLERLTDTISQYDIATVSDLYDLVGLTGSFTDDKWGWSDLRDASISLVRGGYLLNLPQTSPIN